MELANKTALVTACARGTGGASTRTLTKARRRRVPATCREVLSAASRVPALTNLDKVAALMRDFPTRVHSSVQRECSEGQ